MSSHRPDIVMEPRNRVHVQPEEEVMVAEPRPREPRARGRVEIPEAYNINRDRVRWGPIIAGVFAALSSLLILSLLGLAVGLTATNVTPGSAGGAGPLPAEAARNSAVWAAIAALLAFLLGGYVAGGTAAVFDRGWGALNGALVFVVGLPILLWLTSLGLGSVLGIAGSYVSAFNIDPSRAANLAQGAARAVPNVGEAAARSAAWSILGGLLLALGASALGGALGTRRELARERTTSRPPE
jgi:hypothetical protein